MVTTALAQNEPDYRAYLNDILFRQTAGRYAKSWDHAQPAWYHLGVMASMWWPAIFALPWAVPAWRRRLRRRDPRYLLPLAWWAFIIAFFSIPSGKRDVYILPALPMMCLAMAPLLPGIVRRLWPRRIAFATGLVLASAFLVAGAAMWLGEPKFETKMIAERGFTDGGRAAMGLLLAIGAWGVAAMLGHRVQRGVHGLLWMLGGLWVMFSLIGYPLLNDSTSARGLMTHVGRRIGPDAELGLVAWKEQNLLMADRAATDFGFKVLWPEQMKAAMAWQAQAPTRRWLLVQEPALSQCVARERAEFAGIANRRRWWLVPAAAVPDSACVPQGTQTQNEADGQDGDDG
jgi:4-amino-4-deoxy-L-arabinose transferase-like glycosyltransferase